MNFLQLVQQFISNTLDVSLPGFQPELALCATIVLMLLTRVISWSPFTDRVSKLVGSWLPLVGALVALYLARPWVYLTQETAAPPAELFTGLLIHDQLTVYARSFLLAFLALFVVFTQLSGIPDREDAVDFYSLVIGSTVGMCLMASANHLFIVFLAVEMASVPSYALAGILKGRRQSSEAALKYAVFGAGAAGVMLYGISLLSGVLGSAHLPTMAVRLAEMLNDGVTDRYMVLALGGLMLMVGLAFKLSAVPFHFWCPDVFEGASAEVNAFLSVASKAAALILLVRVAVGFGSIPERTLVQATAPAVAAPAESAAPAEAASAERANSSASAPRLAAYRYQDAGTTRGIESPAPAVPTAEAHAEAAATSEAIPGPADRGLLISKLAPVRKFMLILVSIIAAITCTFGNWTAYGQTNIKRLLAYSTIAHAGYMMMPVAAALAAIGVDDHAARDAIGWLGFYVGCYLFMNLGAFAIVAFLRNSLRSEEIADYAGLLRHSPLTVICFGTILVSLIGIPPLAGFMAKFAIFGSLVETHQYPLLIVGGLNTVLSLFYYLRVIWVMAIEPEPESRVPFQLSAFSLEGVFMILITLPVVTLGLWGDWLFRWTAEAAAQLLS